MANSDHLAVLAQGVEAWNRWRKQTNHGEADLSGADLSARNLDDIDLLRANLSSCNLSKTQLVRAQLKDAKLAGATLDSTNLEHATARNAVFDDVRGQGTRFHVSTLRGATFRRARLPNASFHRAYLRDADLTDAVLTGASLRFARFDHAVCENTDFTQADLRYASVVDCNMKGAVLMDVPVFGISAWNVEVDARTRQELLVGSPRSAGAAQLRTHDLGTAQLLALILDGAGMRNVLDSVNSKLVLVLGSFAPEDKPALDAVRSGLQARGYAGVVFDFERPAARDYAETVVILAGLSRFVIADFTHAKEVRAEVLQIRQQYRRVPIVPISKQGASLPVTMANVFSAAELKRLVRYTDVDDLTQLIGRDIVERAETLASEIAASISQSIALLRGD